MSENQTLSLRTSVNVMLTSQIYRRVISIPVKMPEKNISKSSLNLSYKKPYLTGQQPYTSMYLFILNKLQAHWYWFFVQHWGALLYLSLNNWMKSKFALFLFLFGNSVASKMMGNSSRGWSVYNLLFKLYFWYILDAFGNEKRSIWRDWPFVSI